MSTKIPLAQYLFTRLKQHGVHVMHGVPGDFTLQALDLLKPSGIKWVGNCNELNAGYAADGYARIAGLGAFMTTYGVGELSAINALAGSLAERVPVIQIVGVPQKQFLNNGFRLHHSLDDGRNRIFKDMHSWLLLHSWMLDDASKDCYRIDSVIRNAINLGRPHYIAIPTDKVMTPVSAIPLHDPITLNELDLATTHQVVERLLVMLYNAKRPVILVDRGSGMDTVRTEINDFVRRSGIPTLTLPSGASMIDHTLPNYFGVHAGPVGQIDTTDFVASADLVLCLGPMFSDTQTLGWKVLPDDSVTVELKCASIYFRNDESRQYLIHTRSLLRALTYSIEPDKLAAIDVSSLGDFRTIPNRHRTDDDGPINQTSLYHRLNRYLRPHDIILLANATPILGGRDFVLPDPSCRVIVSGMWFSVGHMLPAALGAALAQQYNPIRPSDHGRVILFDGDGSFQATAQELSTIIRERPNVTIFIINNAGYAYERLIHGLNETYNDVAPWDYLSLPAAFGAQQSIATAQAAGEAYSVDTIRLETNAELEAFLQDERFDNGHHGTASRGLKLIDIRVGRTDVPEKFRAVFESAGQTLGAEAKLPESLLARHTGLPEPPFLGTEFVQTKPAVEMESAVEKKPTFEVKPAFGKKSAFDVKKKAAMGRKSPVAIKSLIEKKPVVEMKTAVDKESENHNYNANEKDVLEHRTATPKVRRLLGRRPSVRLVRRVGSPRRRANR